MSDDKISMNHGAGGEVMANLIASTVLDNITKKSVDGGISLDALDDGASIPLGDWEIVFTTDGHTIDPLFFPGGDMCFVGFIIHLPFTSSDFQKPQPIVAVEETKYNIQSGKFCFFCESIDSERRVGKDLKIQA